jgi:hypothetical protein
MTIFRSILVLSLFWIASPLSAQVTLDPFFASQDDTVTVYYNAAEGNGALIGQQQIYAHAGVITTASSGPTDWKYVQGNWGTADPNVAMTNEGNDIHSISFHIPTFYGFPNGTEVLSLAFVFRTADGSIVGRTSAGGDIFVPLYTGYGAILAAPTEDVFILQTFENLSVAGLASDPSTLSLFVDDSLLASESNATEIAYNLNTQDFGIGKHYIILDASDGNETIRDTSYYVMHAPTVFEAEPAGTKDGVNYLNDSTVILKLTCPIKSFAYVIGDFNQWELDEPFAMKRSLDSSAFWIEISDLVSGEPYRYQFVVDEEMIRIADPYAHLILDPWNDPWIPASSYPNLLPYPTGKTNEAVSVLQTAQSPYNWDQNIAFERPSPTDLRIYELLIRDFSDARTFQSVIDSLNYLKKLGINAIELMPVNEFEGNNSWGYNPSFYFATDKYYGPSEKLKELVEEAHRNGIAIILDMVLNHSFGQSPLVRLFFDAAEYKPSENNPWFLQDPAHDFNVGYDLDHESPWTRKFVDDVMRFWVEEYHIDGYRMDLSKGFTSNVTIGNVGLWGQVDSSRIYNLTRMAEQVWQLDSSVYIILEHFADNNEEKELSSRGFMLWGNVNHAFNEATMGYDISLSNAASKNRGWADPHLVSYMESHDEERLMYRNLNYGDAHDDYDTRKPWIALKRMEAAAVYFLSIPGPKMCWQFGEMGYDLSINRCENGSISNDCRLSPKPPRWYYLENSDRKRLFEVYAAMNALREQYPVFASTDYSLSSLKEVKTIRLNGAEMNAVTACNFGLEAMDQAVTFQHEGTWYEYFTGDSITISGTSETLSMDRGEYRVYTDQRLTPPSITAAVADPMLPEVLVYPNPTSDNMWIESDVNISALAMFDLSGRRVQAESGLNGSLIPWNTSGLAPGTYILLITTEQGQTQERVVIR